MAEQTALLDSGATENFISFRTWKQLGIGRQELNKPIMVHNVDGTENKRGKITHYCWLRNGGACAFKQVECVWMR